MNDLKRGPGRPRKDEALDRRRRRKPGEFRTRLSVDEASLDKATYEYRFANDSGMRIQDLTVHDDWEVVSDPSRTTKGDTASLGSGVMAQVGTDSGGKPIQAHLLRKRREFCDADRREAQAKIDEQMNQIRRGPSPEQGGIGAEGSHAYVPSEGIKIQDGRR